LKGGGEFRAWQQLAFDINRGKCVPILGSGVLEPFVGTTREVANRLARASGFPLALGGREDLPQVAQFLKTMRDKNSPQVQIPVVSEMAEAVRERYPVLDLGPVSAIDPGNDLRERLTAAWRVYQEGRPYEPHRYLAGLRQIRTVITTNPDDLLKEALTAAGRAPRVHLCRWDGEAGDEAAAGDPAGPAGDRPDVFQLMGHLSDLDSLVVTEDDYFRFLTAVARRPSQKKDPKKRNDDLADDRLRGALATSALLFLGFRMADWDFRTLCRVLLDQHGRQGRRDRTHIAVQIDPEDGTHGEAVEARAFIEKLFQELLGGPTSSQVVVYWGSAENFLEDLDRRWKQLQTGPAPSAATA
jgi:hypothetical protein